MDEVRFTSKPDEQVVAEPWLQLLNLEFWNSAAQKEACWTVLRASEGSTSLIALQRVPARVYAFNCWA